MVLLKILKLATNKTNERTKKRTEIRRANAKLTEDFHPETSRAKVRERDDAFAGTMMQARKRAPEKPTGEWAPSSQTKLSSLRSPLLH